MAKKEFDWVKWIIGGLLIGIPVGLVIKSIIDSLSLSAQTASASVEMVYGASYAYDRESGRLTSYTPIPIPIPAASSVRVVQTVPTTQSQTEQSSATRTEIPPPGTINEQALAQLRTQSKSDTMWV